MDLPESEIIGGQAPCNSHLTLSPRATKYCKGLILHALHLRRGDCYLVNIDGSWLLFRAASMDIEIEIRRLIERRSPAARNIRDLSDDLKLYDGGLGLDSLDLIRLILDCEDRFGIEFSREFLDSGNFTIGALIDQVRDARLR